MAKYEDVTDHKCFRGGSNTDIKIITCEDYISILQKYVLHWYHTYLLHSGMDISEAMFCQHFYWPGIRYSVWKEVPNCDTCQRKKRSNKNMVITS